ncbi:N-acetyltransferase family protein [Serpentinicella sp. ANB-PHB4]|uniref:GNAT family N-acetyltransferase n=1 Tax=Serpentinicella sp. ANB-PHB4 TaxID=3074076 RepID=UPI0028645F84|nr:N-acetyltransferase family protein [Serpentinicella sp. ANB-PHB4]MDR5659474.1 N-acetyltransferase family protein [Serpentinicella sp. ANB-PHB4]
MKLQLEHFKHKDWHQVREIFIQGIKTGNATYTKEPPTLEQWQDTYIKDSQIVAKLEGQVLGWAALKLVSNRPVFSGVAEVSIYIAENYRGHGVGKTLLKKIIEISEEQGFWTLEAKIFPENEKSLSLHKKFGFEKVGIRKKMGQMNGIWRDIVLLERRSQIVGID